MDYVPWIPNEQRSLSYGKGQQHFLLFQAPPVHSLDKGYGCLMFLVLHHLRQGCPICVMGATSSKGNLGVWHMADRGRDSSTVADMAGRRKQKSRAVAWLGSTGQRAES